MYLASTHAALTSEPFFFDRKSFPVSNHSFVILSAAARSRRNPNHTDKIPLLKLCSYLESKPIHDISEISGLVSSA